MEFMNNDNSDEFVDAFGDVEQLQSFRARVSCTSFTENRNSDPQHKENQDFAQEKIPTITITNINTQITINNRFSTPSSSKKDYTEASPQTRRHAKPPNPYDRNKWGAGFSTPEKPQPQVSNIIKHNTESVDSNVHEATGSQTSDDTSVNGNSQDPSGSDTSEQPSRRFNYPNSGTKISQNKEISDFGGSENSSSENMDNGSPNLDKKRRSKRKKGDLRYKSEVTKLHNLLEPNFSNLTNLQELSGQQLMADDTKPTAESASSSWVAKFSPDENFLAMAGADCIMRVFMLSCEVKLEQGKSGGLEPEIQLINPTPLLFAKHTSDIIDVDWSKDSSRLLTASIDHKAVLWSLKSKYPLQVFEHSDIVACACFHPLVDEFSVTGCFDKIIRIWDATDKKVVDWVQANDMITALCFSPDKQYLLAGFFKGTVKMYRADQGKLKYEMEIVCKNSFVFGKINKVGKKVTGILFCDENEFLVTTNDSRMRLIDFRTFKTVVKYKGNSNKRYQIRPHYSSQKEMIVSGSEDHKVFVWRKYCEPTVVPQGFSLFASKKESNRNTSFETFKPFPNKNTLCALFVPYGILKRFKEKLSEIWRELYLDCLILMISQDSDIKVVGNLIELEY